MTASGPRKKTAIHPMLGARSPAARPPRCSGSALIGSSSFQANRVLGVPREPDTPPGGEIERLAVVARVDDPRRPVVEPDAPVGHVAEVARVLDGRRGRARLPGGDETDL